MRQREQLKTLPAHLDYFTAEVPGLGEVRLVLPLFADRIAHQQERDRFVARVNAREVQSAESLATGYGLAAALVGLGWAHPSLELETDRAAFGSLREYGVAVIAELESAGAAVEDVIKLGQHLGRAVTDSLTTLAEATETVPFSKVRRGASGSSSSEQAPATAATPGRRTASRKTSGGS